ncbi:MAG: hypothetical protein L3J29_08210 [Cyclobacteriaceae bacterium]|nr:hypothetical protein [Cyclobacteriaceae bacterium]
MENKLNQPALEEYAKKYADLLTTKIFSEKNSISGRQVMDEVPVNQVALFALFNIFKKWKLEMGQLKSPYFNYEHDNVQIKLKELMNVLSQHILISKEDFGPILAKSVQDTLLLIISPLSYYKELVEEYKETAPNMDEVKDLQRFIKTNSHMRDALLTAWASDFKGEELFDKAFEGLNEPPSDVPPLLSPFNELLELDIANIWIEEEAGIAEEKEDSDEIDNAPEPEQLEEVEMNTIHGQFKEDKTEILADSLGFEASKDSLKSMLTINQKFMFINDLFDGNKEDFMKVIDFLDSCETKEVVLKFVNSNYIARGNWKREAPQVKEFLELINKKFG